MKPERISKPALSFVGHYCDVSSIEFSRDKSVVLSTGDGWNGSARIWNVNTATELFRVSIENLCFSCASMTLDGSTIVTGHSDGRVRFWDVSEKVQIFEHYAARGMITASASLHNGSKVAVGYVGGFVDIWDVETQKIVHSFDQKTMEHPSAGFVKQIAFNNEQTLMSVSTSKGQARVWDVIGGLEKMSFRGCSSAVFSANDNRILTSDDWGIARVCDASTGQEILHFQSHMYLRDAQFSQDGWVIVTVGAGRKIKFWNSSTGEQIGELIGMSYPTLSARFFANDLKVLVAGTGGALHAYDVPL